MEKDLPPARFPCRTCVCRLRRMSPGPDERQALASTGRLRVALLSRRAGVDRSRCHAKRVQGSRVCLGKELARRIGVPFEPLVYPSPGAIMGGLKSGEWDVIFFGPNSERGAVLNFTPAFLVIEHGYLVPAGSPIATIDGVDRPGTRIGAPQGGFVNAFWRAPSSRPPWSRARAFPPAQTCSSPERWMCSRPTRLTRSSCPTHCPARAFLEGRIGVDEVAIARPKDRTAGIAYLRRYV